MKITSNPGYTPPKKLPRPARAVDRLDSSLPGPAPVAHQSLLALVGGPQPPLDRVRIQTEFLSNLRHKGLVVSATLEARNALDSGFRVRFQGDDAALRQSYRQAVALGSLTQAQADEALARLQSGPLNGQFPLALSGDPAMAARLPADTVLATPGSIEALAAAAGGPERVIGMRFPSPADRTRVVEVVPGPQTSPQTLAQTLAYVRAIGKSPLLVGNSPGLVLERVSLTLVNQGLRLFDELKSGDPQRDQLLATQIDQVALQTFWPRSFQKAPEELRSRALTPAKAASGPQSTGPGSSGRSDASALRSGLCPLPCLPKRCSGSAGADRRGA